MALLHLNRYVDGGDFIIELYIWERAREVEAARKLYLADRSSAKKGNTRRSFNCGSQEKRVMALPPCLYNFNLTVSKIKGRAQKGFVITNRKYPSIVVTGKQTAEWQSLSPAPAVVIRPRYTTNPLSRASVRVVKSGKSHGF